MPRMALQTKAVVTAKTEHTVELTATQTTTLRTALKTYRLRSNQAKAIKGELKEVRGEMETVLDEVGEASIGLDDAKMTIVAPVRKKLDQAKLTKLLIAKGVKSSVIAEALMKATKETPGEPYVKVTLAGEEEDDE